MKTIVRSIVVGMALTLGVASALAKPPISIEIAQERGGPLTASKDWYEALTAAGVDSLRIRSFNDGDQVKVEEVGAKSSPIYEVHGILKANNTLLLPNGKFTLRDRAAIKQWLEKLGAGGVGAIAGQKSAFGLSPDQLREANADLKKPVDFSTRDMTIGDMVKRCGESRAFPLVVDNQASETVASTKIQDQLRGLATGTALAAALRPAGLVLAPRVAAGGVVFRIGKPSGGEFWPIGWTPTERNVKVLPKLFEMEEVEIDDTPLPDALDAIGDRLEAPLLLDYNAMALHGIEPDKVKIKLPAKRLSYSLMLQKVLFQARLKPELRTDDAGKPFMWITSIKPAQ